MFHSICTRSNLRQSLLSYAEPFPPYFGTGEKGMMFLPSLTIRGEKNSFSRASHLLLSSIVSTHVSREEPPSAGLEIKHYFLSPLGAGGEDNSRTPVRADGAKNIHISQGQKCVPHLKRKQNESHSLNKFFIFFFWLKKRSTIARQNFFKQTIVSTPPEAKSFLYHPKQNFYCQLVQFLLFSCH